MVGCCDVCEMIDLCGILKAAEVDIKELDAFRACDMKYDSASSYRDGIKEELKRLKELNNKP